MTKGLGSRLRHLVSLQRSWRLSGIQWATFCFGLCVLAGLVWAGISGRGSARSKGATWEQAPNGQGRMITVPPGGDFQSAIDQAQPGDTIVLTSGATYEGHFTLPAKAGHQYVTVCSSALDHLPPKGSRVDPKDAPYMPKLVSPDASPVVVAARGAHHFRFVGIEFHPATRVYMFNLIAIGRGDEDSLEDLPHDFIFDRDYIHGDPDVGARRGIYLSGGAVTVENSYLSDFKGIGEDTQTLSGSNTPGPLNIINNFLEASGENIIFGGGRTYVPDMVPSDIVIRHNYFYKPLYWRKGDPSYAGTEWTVKNLLELKRGRRVTIEGNLFENNWPHAQSGVAILFTVRTDGGHTPWSVVEDITFRNNILRHAASGFTITGHDDNGMGHEKNILIENNLIEDISRQHWGADGKMFQLLEGTDGVMVDHNTITGDGLAALILGGTIPHMNFVMRNNIMPYGLYGIWSKLPSGSKPLSGPAPGAIMTKNIFVKDSPHPPNASLFPPGNFLLTSWRDVHFANFTDGDLHLVANSPYRKAGTDGKDLGADLEAIARATAGVESGR